MAETHEDARGLAWDVVRRVDETGAFADALLNHRLVHCHLERRDQALATQLVYGALAWRGLLDLAITTFAARPAESVEAPVRALLEIALFQLFKLERVPSYAAVASAVDLAKTYRNGRAAGFVNAVLRRAAREGLAAVPLPDRQADLPGHLAAAQSHPRWLVERWLQDLGEAETETLLIADNVPAPTVFRVNRRRGDRATILEELRAAGIVVEPGSFSPDAIIPAPGPAAEGKGGAAAAIAPWIRSGRLSHQAEASQLVTQLLDPQPGERILDACAGGGGKATHLAEIQGDDGRIVAFDLHRHSLSRLGAEAERLGLGSIAVAIADARRLPARQGFDRILLDAPCSGFGTLRQHPEIRWRRSERDVSACARLQRDLLASLLPALRPGGVLVYAVCTISRAENAAIVDAALAAHPGVVRQDARDTLPAAAHALVDDRGDLCTAPHRGGLDGFYAVRLKRC